jgi:tRNA (guanine-N7-)-methyltransferase
MKNPRKRLSSTFFLDRYRRFLTDGGTVHLKTDSNFLFTYTTLMVEKNHLPLLFRTEDLYHTDGIDEATRRILAIQTYYERQWMERGLNIRYMKFLPATGRPPGGARRGNSTRRLSQLPSLQAQQSGI